MKYILKIFLIFLISVSALMPLTTFAQSTGSGTSITSGLYRFNTSKILPYAQKGNTMDFIGRFIYLLLMFLAPVAMGIGIYGGITMVRAHGNDTLVKKGQAALIAAASGTALVLFSYIAVAALQSFLIS